MRVSTRWGSVYAFWITKSCLQLLAHVFFFRTHSTRKMKLSPLLKKIVSTCSCVIRSTAHEMFVNCVMYVYLKHRSERLRNASAYVKFLQMHESYQQTCNSF